MTMTGFPVRCSQGHFYLTPAGTLRLGTGIRADVRDIEYGPCPQCGSPGMIEDGSYCLPANWRQRFRIAWSVLTRGYV